MAVLPILDVDIRLPVRFTDGGGRDFAAPQGLRAALHAPDGYACQVHLDEGFFYTTFTAAVPLNDGSLKGDSLELGYLQGDIPGSSGEVSAIVAAAVALALLIVLVPGCLCQLLRLGLQQLVEGFLHAASYQLLKPPLDNILV